MIHFMKLHPGTFSKMKFGDKTVELRLYKEEQKKYGVLAIRIERINA